MNVKNAFRLFIYCVAKHNFSGHLSQRQTGTELVAYNRKVK